MNTRKWLEKNTSSLAGRCVAITGSTGGLGRELCGYLAGECSIDDAAESIKQATRRYAKRQMTWFKRNKKILWFDAADLQDFSDIIQASRSFAEGKGYNI